MNRFFSAAGFILAGLFAQVAFAQDAYVPLAKTQVFSNQLSLMTQSVGSIESDFIQEKNLSVLSEKIISKGKFYYKKENNIRWEYSEPYNYLIIISNNQLYTRDDKNQKQFDIESNKMFQEMSRFISGCIQGDILKDDKNYKIEYFENSKRYFVRLFPNNEKMKQMLREVQIYFDKKDLTVASLKMIESGDDYTRIDFINKKLNTNIPVEKFSFR
jgi:outer membrane lipoprotein-sorting protein